MNRLRDYVGFAVWFAGAGYVAIWPLSASGTSGALFGAPLLCHTPPAFGLLAGLCHTPHPLTLSPTLHVLGLASAIIVTVRLACRALRRIRRARASEAPALHRIRMAPPPVPRPELSPPLPRVKQRREFGLRGVTR
jgi:hypothetical protein